MSIAGAVRAAIRRCGREVSLTENGVVKRFYACIQPRTYDTQVGIQTAESVFGEIDTRRFVYYGPLTDGGEAVDEGTVLTVGNERYLVGLCHDFFVGTDCLFRWAAVRQMNGGNMDEPINSTQV